MKTRTILEHGAEKPTVHSVLTSPLVVTVVTIALTVALVTVTWEPIALWLVGHSDALPIPRSADSR